MGDERMREYCVEGAIGVRKGVHVGRFKPDVGDALGGSESLSPLTLPRIEVDAHHLTRRNALSDLDRHRAGTTAAVEHRHSGAQVRQEETGARDDGSLLERLDDARAVPEGVALSRGGGGGRGGGAGAIAPPPLEDLLVANPGPPPLWGVSACD